MATATHIRSNTFRPYPGLDVTGHVRIDLPGIGSTWCRLRRTEPVYREWVEAAPYAVECLGWGPSPAVLWYDLTDEVQDALLATLTN
jgi:hypothetical protein